MESCQTCYGTGDTFNLRTGSCLSGELAAIATFPVKVEDDHVWVELPPAHEMGRVRANPQAQPSTTPARVPEQVA